MKRERVQFLVTCSLGYNTPAERREAIAAARENLLSVSEGRTARLVKATIVKDAALLPDNSAYFYTYRLPRYHGGSPGPFTYWRVKDGEEAIGLAHSLYKTTQFHIEVTDAASYRAAKVKGN